MKETYVEKDCSKRYYKILPHIDLTNDKFERRAAAIFTWVNTLYRYMCT